MTPLRLSIVIPSHNRPDLLEQCLASVQRHAPGGTQVIVVDDGSQASSAARLAARFSVHSIRHARALGFAAAANRGIAAATGDVIELLNDDTQVTADWVDEALKWFADPSIAAVAPLVLQGPRAGPPIIDSAGDEYHRGGYARKRHHNQPLSRARRQPCEVFGASASSAFYRSTALRAVGGFPEDFGAYFEDVDLAWRLQRAGYRAIFEPGSVVWHRVGSSYRQSRVLIERQSRNEELVYWRNVPNARRMLPRHIAVLAGKGLRRLREGTLLPWLFGRFRAWSMCR